MARYWGSIAAALVALNGVSVTAARGAEIDFNRDIRPILSENCFFCHGQDPAHRKAELRLDVAAEAMADRGGYAAIVPGKPEASELIARITASDIFTVMPPADSNRSLTDREKQLLKQWIAQGAEYNKHWAFIPPVRPPLPAVSDVDWPRGPIDYFVAKRLEEEGLKPSQELPPALWLRRASFDLTGLPPTIEQLDRFIADIARRGEAAYDAAADRLLASPHYGERMALAWMDVARYADTHGFNNDSARTMWRWRDYVIDSFNRNQPYDEFITEQLAGDLLPDPTLEQRIATGFNRNHGINSEGGIIAEEYRVEYVADRVETLGMAWLGLTIKCARCHDHKFDPITQKDYYRLFAFFNNVPEFGEDGRVANAAPLIPAPTEQQQARLAELDSRLHELRAALGEREASLDERIPDWRQRVPKPKGHAFMNPVVALAADGEQIVNAGVVTKDESREIVKRPVETTGQVKAESGTIFTFSGGWANLGKPLKLAANQAMTFAAWVQWNGGEGPLLSSLDYGPPPSAANFGTGLDYRILEDGRVSLGHSTHWPNYAARVISKQAVPRGQWFYLVITYDGSEEARGIRLFINGRQWRTTILNDDLLSSRAWVREVLLGGTHEKDGPAFHGKLAEVRIYDRAVDARTIRERAANFIATIATAKRSDGVEVPVYQRESNIRRAFLRANDEEYAAKWTKANQIAEQWYEVYRDVPTTMVMQEMTEPRQTYILERGEYDAHGEPVTAGVPEELLAPWPKGAPKNRLGLAMWLTQPEHPLTSRVVVNRIWQRVFGTGLVKTSADFGFQGEYPSHPELLDWLAVEFVESGWDVKHMMKLIVLSATYRQKSAVSPELQARDPENRLLARGPRFRLPAEMIRDQALVVSGLLQRKVGGPSVYPYQPKNLYKGIVVGADYPGTKWLLGEGAELYRRSMYTFWKRTVPHPAMSVFDAPTRSVCTVRRSITNTPLQALNLLNGPIYIEAARKLAERMILEGGQSPESRIVYAFRLATSRKPTAEQTRVLTSSLEQLSESFKTDPAAAEALLKVGQSPINHEIPRETLAAYAALASMILNLDEVITK